MTSPAESRALTRLLSDRAVFIAAMELQHTPAVVTTSHARSFIWPWIIWPCEGKNKSAEDVPLQRSFTSPRLSCGFRCIKS